MNKDIKKKVAFLLDGFGNRRHYIQLLALKEAGFEPKIITFEQAKEGYVSAKGIAKDFSIILPFPRSKIMKTFSIKCALTLLKLLKNENIQIVLTHRYKLLRYLWFCKFFYPQLKIIFHIVIAESIKRWHQRFLFKICKKWIDKILVNSLNLKEELIRKKLASEKEIEIFYSGLDISEFEINISKAKAKSLFKLEENVFVFGMIAQFRKEKDQKGVIKALKLLKEKGYKVRLILTGNGPKFNECRKLVKKLKLEKEVIFTGRINPLEIPVLLKALDAFVYATFKEGMPMAVLEAMASELPIIATEAEGLPDIFQSPYTFGILIPKGNIEKIAEAMEKIINLSEEERILWGKRAKERIKDFFSSEHLKERTIKLFQELSI